MDWYDKMSFQTDKELISLTEKKLHLSKKEVGLYMLLIKRYRNEGCEEKS
jgi:uncharacterized protein YdaU (DUF1376 family)